jgi:rare lipoprotein A
VGATGVAAAAQPDTTPSVSVSDRTPATGQRVVVTGKAQTSYGRRLTLEFAPHGSSAFTALATTTVGHGDRYSVAAKPPGTGSLRVTVIPNAQTAPVSSRAVGLRVARAALTVSARHLRVRAGRAAMVSGRGVPGQQVRLQVRRSARWSTLATARVRGNGRFVARARPHAAMSARARVVARAVARSAGRLEVYRYAQASWYGPGLYGGHLACGGTLQPGTLGVANKSLPCGAKVTLRHGSHSVRVPVVDRGPYAGNREFDLTAATAHRLHFSGTGAILTTR